jgi:hypothetical protein
VLNDAPLIFNIIPEVALLVFPTRSFYLGIQLQARYDLVRINDGPKVENHGLFPVGLFELGIRL